MDNLDQDKQKLIQNMEELQLTLEKTKKEKRKILNELNSLKIEKKEQKKDKEQEQASLKYSEDVVNLIKSELTSFSQFTDEINNQQFQIEEFQESFKTINQISNDSHLRLEEKIPPFFTAVRSIILSCLQQSQTLHIQDLDNESTSETSEIMNQLKQKNKTLKKQIKHEHKMIANFAKNFDQSATTVVDDESFVRSQLQILSNSMIVDYSKYKKLIERDFGKIENDKISLPDLLEYSFSKFKEVDDFIQKLFLALEIDPNENNYDSVLSSLQNHLSIIPKLKNSASQLKNENEILQNHCNEMEQIIQKQSQEFNKSHKNVVQRLQDQIKELQQRCNDSRLEEITQILSDKDQESKILSKKVGELEETEIKHKDKITELNLSLIKQMKQNEELNSTYELSLKKLKEEQKLSSQLRDEIHQKDIKFRELKEDMLGQINQLTQTNEKLRYTAEEEQKTEIEELRQLTKKSISELSKMKKKVKKYQMLFQKSENSRLELESKLTELNEIQEENSIQINKLRTHLKHSKSTMLQISDEYRQFKQEHMKTTSKLSDYQTKVKYLTDQNELLTNQLNESQLSIETIENSTCSKKDLEKCFVDIQSKEKEIRELRTAIAKQNSTISAYESRQPILEQFRDKYSEVHETLRQKNDFVSNLNSIVKDIHYYLTMIFQNKPNASPTVIEILQRMKPLFNVFQLPLFSFDFIKANSCSFFTYRIANIRPDVDFEILSQQHKLLLSRILEEIEDLPLDQTVAYSSLNSLSSTLDKLNHILDMVKTIKNAFQEQNNSLLTLTSLYKNQQSAIVRMARNSPSKK